MSNTMTLEKAITLIMGLPFAKKAQKKSKNKRHSSNSHNDIMRYSEIAYQCSTKEQRG